MIYELIFLIPEIVLGLAIEFVWILRSAKNQEINQTKVDIQLGPVNKKTLGAMTEQTRKDVIKTTIVESASMLAATVGLALITILLLQYSKWCALVCVVMQLIVLVVLYLKWSTEIKEKIHCM